MKLFGTFAVFAAVAAQGKIYEFRPYSDKQDPAAWGPTGQNQLVRGVPRCDFEKI